MDLANIYLTTRKREILQAMYEGHDTYKQVASHLGISPHTVRTHLHEIYQVTGIVGKAALMVAAIENGWIETKQASVFTNV